MQQQSTFPVYKNFTNALKNKLSLSYLMQQQSTFPLDFVFIVNRHIGFPLEGVRKVFEGVRKVFIHMIVRGRERAFVVQKATLLRAFVVQKATLLIVSNTFGCFLKC